MKYMAIMLSLFLLAASIIACSDKKEFPPPEGYSSWDEYHDKREEEKAGPRDALYSLVSDILGKCNREGMPKILEFNAVEEGGGYDVELFFAIDDNLTEGFIKGGARLDIFDTMKALYSSNYNMQHELHLPDKILRIQIFESFLMY